jgi:hypothetical protein
MKTIPASGAAGFIAIFTLRPECSPVLLHRISFFMVL